MRTRSISLTLLALLGAWGAYVPGAHAAWPRDPYVNLPISVTLGHDVSPATTSDGTDGVIIAWTDNRNGTNDIFVQRVNSKGVPLWTTNGVALCTAAGGQTSVVIASDGSGGAIVSWQDFRNGVNNDVYARRVSASGVPQWTPDGVAISTAANYQSAPAIIPDGNGGAIITWFDNRTGDDNVYVQRINAAGAVQWTGNGVALCTVAGSQNYPKLVADGAGGAIVIWADWRRWQDSDVFAQRVNAAGIPQWTANGVDMTMSSNLYRYDPTLMADGAGGAIAAWVDDRNSTTDVYVQRVNASGALQWSSGVKIGPTTGSSAKPRMASDGAGGAFVTWRELPPSFTYDIFAARVTAAGVAPWSVDAVPVCTVTGQQENPDIVSDGQGGAIITWQDGRAGTSQRDIFAQRLDGAGIAQWAANGIPLCSVFGDQVNPATTADTRGGVLVAWQDFRSGLTHDIYAERIERTGRLGTPEPEIAWVRDVPNEQGSRVRINWNRSYLDSLPGLAIGSYGIWRQVTGTFAASAIARGGRWFHEAGTSPAAPGTFRVEASASQVTYWEGVGSIPARGEPWYSFVAETFQDSTSAANPYTTFMVDAHGAFTPIFWSSVSDSGYSVDNLPPGVPPLFTGQYAGGSMHLDWDPSPENDLSNYRLYRGSTAGFTPGPGNRIATPTSTDYVDAVPAGSYYKLSAVDVHGNEGGFASLSGTTGVPGGDRVGELSLEGPRPNPARRSTTLRISLPRQAPASLAIFDASGRRIRGLLQGVQPAGERAITWDLRDDHGAMVPNGLYLARLDTEDGRILRRVIALR